MEERKRIDDEEKQAKLEMWEYALGFTPMAVVKCAIQLQIADVLEAHGGAMTHSDLSAAVGCSPTILHRIMRYLIHRRFFKQSTVTPESPISYYTNTPLSKLLIKNGENSFAALVLLHSSAAVLASWLKMSSGAQNIGVSPFEAAHGKDLWAYASDNPAHSDLFDDGMSCFARQFMTAIVDQYPEAFAGIRSLVDVGGGNGTALRILVKACPWIHGINFDLPRHVASDRDGDGGIEYVAGNMFDQIPKADAAFLMFVLHDWSDEDCIRILKKCREAIPSDVGKVIIADIVIRDEEDKYNDARLTMDMVMFAHTDGKERTYEEWGYVVKQAGFSRFSVKNIEAMVSVIEAYP